MPSSITTDRAYLVAVCLESIFYGLNTLLLIVYLCLLPKGTNFKTNTKLLVPLAATMFLLSSARLALDIYRLFDGFIFHDDPAAFFSDVSVPSHVAKSVVHTFNGVLGDAVVVWRCYLVWGRNYRICIIPAALVFASAVAGLGQAITFSRCTSVFDPALLGWNSATFLLSFLTNLGVTLLIAVRIVIPKKRHPDVLPRNSFYRLILLTVVESGSVYSAALLINVVLYFLRNNAFYIVYDPVGQLTVIVPLVIMVTAEMGLLTRSSSDAVSLATRKQTEGSNASGVGFVSGPGHSYSDHSSDIFRP